MSDASIIPIYDLKSVGQLQRRLRIVINRFFEEGYTIVKRSGWVAVPVESGEHFDDADQSNLLHALLARNYNSMLAVAVEDLGDHPHAYIVSATREGLAAFNRELSFLSFALFAGEPDWVILCTKQGYFVVAGPPDFVTQVLGRNLEEAFSDFHAFAADPWWTDQGRTGFLFLLNQLQFVYPVEHDGVEVKLEPSTPPKRISQ